VLTAEESGGLLRSVDTGTVVGLPNSVLIAVMVLNVRPHLRGLRSPLSHRYAIRREATRLLPVAM